MIAYKKGKPWAEETIRTAGEAKKLVATADRYEINSDDDLSFIKAEVRDEQGNIVPAATNMIEFSIEGPGEIVATDNGDPGDLVSFSSTKRTAFSGLALAIIRSKRGAAGTIKVVVKSVGLRDSKVEVIRKNR